MCVKMKTKISVKKAEVLSQVPPTRITTFSSPKFKDIFSLYKGSVRESDDSIKHESTRPLENSQTDGFVRDLLILHKDNAQNASSRRTSSTQAYEDSYQHDCTKPDSDLSVSDMICMVILYSLSVVSHIAAFVLGYVSFIPCQSQKYIVLYMISSGTYGVLLISWMTLMQSIKTTSTDKAKTLVAWVGLLLVFLPIASTFTFFSCGVSGRCGQNSHKRDWSNMTCLTSGNFGIYYRIFNIFFGWNTIHFILFYKKNSILFNCCGNFLLLCSYFVAFLLPFL